jgi:transcriptional regulator with AAA-type ATPase domain
MRRFIAIGVFVAAFVVPVRAQWVVIDPGNLAQAILIADRTLQEYEALENAVERACALATGEVIDVDDLPDEVRQHHTLVITSEQVRPLRDVEREYILAALERNQGSRTVTAEQLRIGLATLRRKLKSYGKAG